jgi:hypothetical protein
MSPGDNGGSELTSTTFVGFVPEAGGAERRGASRLSHKKSRTGCQRCRTRRVKVSPLVLPSALQPFFQNGFVVDLVGFAGQCSDNYTV